MDGQYPANQDDDYQAAARAMEDDSKPTHKPQHSAPRHKSRRTPLVLAIVVILAGLGVGAYLLTKHASTKKPAAKTSTSTAQSTTQVPTTPSATTTTHYVSAEKNLSLEFDYPANWTVTPAAADSAASAQPITIESVPSTITNAAGANVTGKATITIRPGSATISELASGNATAAQASVQIGYTHPTASQHQYPFLTFVHLAGGADPNAAFEEVMITGIQQFAAGNPVTPGSLSELDPIIAASFSLCNTTACSGSTAGTLSITNATWQNTQVLQQVLALFESLKLN